MIEEIESRCPELEALPFTRLKSLVKRQVAVEVSGPLQIRQLVRSVLKRSRRSISWDAKTISIDVLMRGKVPGWIAGQYWHQSDIRRAQDNPVCVIHQTIGQIEVGRER